MKNSSTESSKRGLSNFPTDDHQLKRIKIETLDDEAENHNFPEEIFMEILLRLPVKTILKLRCISKSWLFLISTPQFIKTQLKISSKEPSFYNLRVMISINYPVTNLMHCSALSLSSPLVTYPVDIDYPKKNTNSCVRVVGSCNGLVCITRNEKDMFLWNPSTRISYRLPRVNGNRILHLGNAYGFGYDESTDDYKVLIIHEVLETGVYRSVVKLFSLRNSSWKSIEDFNAGRAVDVFCKLVNGKIHFSTTLDLGSNIMSDIVSLDMKSEVYGRVEQPNYGEGVNDASLAVLGGCLSVLGYHNLTRLDLWVMKEHGVRESWTKVATIPYLYDPWTPLGSKPLCMLPNGDILLFLESHFVVYNLKKLCLRRCEIEDMDDFVDADILIESLVSPIPNARLMAPHR